MEAINYLMQHRNAISRTWTKTSDGITADTTSSDADVAAMIQRHVHEMKQLIGSGGKIRVCDPLFALLESKHADVALDNTNTTHGVSVRSYATNGDDCLAECIQAHAGVVSAFIKEGSAQTRRCRAHNPPQCAYDNGWVTSAAGSMPSSVPALAFMAAAVAAAHAL